MFENIHGFCLNSSEGCKACGLGDYTRDDLDSDYWRPEKHKRCVGRGREGAPIMLIGDSPKDVDEFGVHRYQLAGVLKEASEHRMVRALQELGIHPDLIYGTTAVKCSYRISKDRGSKIPATFLETCRENHLGVEIEVMQPAIIWVTGFHSADAVRRHFGMKVKDRLGVGKVMMMDAPAIWRFDKLLIVRSSHPADLFRDCVEHIARFVEVYLREFLYGRRRVQTADTRA